MKKIMKYSSFSVKYELPKGFFRGLCLMGQNCLCILIKKSKADSRSMSAKQQFPLQVISLSSR